MSRKDMIIRAMLGDKEKRDERICPLMESYCKLYKCMWFLSDKDCAILRIAMKVQEEG